MSFSASVRGLATAAVLLCSIVLQGCKDKTSLASLPAEGARSGPRAVQTVVVTESEATDAIQATGTTAPLNMTKIMPLVPGLIVSLPVKEGDQVKRGQVVATIDQRGFRLNVRQAEAAIAAARVAVDATRREKERFQKLMQEDATAKAQFDQVMDRFRGAEAQMNQALVARDMAKKALGDTILRAPYDGVITKKLASVGDYATSMPPTVLLVMVDNGTLELKVSLPEPDLERVSVGAPLSATFASLGRTVETKIARIIRSVDMMTRSFEVIGEIPNSDLSLKPGLFADVKIQAAKARKRYVIPASAVIDEGAGVFSVLVVREGSAHRVRVRIATVSPTKVEVLSGLNGQETVVTDPSGIYDGDPVAAPASAPAQKPEARR
jgi:RND family efflux transporter MFP subunit